MSEPILDKITIISDQKGDRFDSLIEEIDVLRNLSEDIEYIYKYSVSSLGSDIYQKYCGILPYNRPKIHKLIRSEYMSPKAFALAMNHVECLNIISKCDESKWSMVCEDDVYIPDKSNFLNQFIDLMTTKPSDADIIWISSGKKDLGCSYRNITGHDPLEELNYKHTEKYCKIPESRYTDCILIKNSVSHILLDSINKYMISYPIDWEYNFLLKFHPNINSYWLQPSIIRQNPLYL